MVRFAKYKFLIPETVFNIRFVAFFALLPMGRRFLRPTSDWIIQQTEPQIACAVSPKKRLHSSKNVAAAINSPLIGSVITVLLLAINVRSESESVKTR